MTIEILYFPDCPNYLPAVEHVQKALREEHASAEIKHLLVLDAFTATATGFLGSPTVRINGIDVEPSARWGGSAGMCCRTYTGGSGRAGAPSVALIRDAIREAAASGKDCCARK
jgi:hypothetical protein